MIVVRAGAEEPLQPALVQRRRGVVERHVRHLVPLGHLADRGRGGAGIAADQRHHMLLRDQPLGLGAGLLRIVLVVGEDDADMGTLHMRQPTAVAEQHRDRCVVGVDDVRDHPDRRLRVRPDLRRVARQRIDRADGDVLGPRGRQPGGQHGCHHPKTRHSPASPNRCVPQRSTSHATARQRTPSFSLPRPSRERAGVRAGAIRSRQPSL